MDIPSNYKEQIKNIKELEISYRNLHTNLKITNTNTSNDILVPFASITNKYRHYLEKIIIPIKLNEKEQIRYRYQPKKLSLELYGTTELWNDLLIINNCVSIRTFTPKVVKVYDPDNYKKYLNEIMIIEAELGNIIY